MIPTALFVYGTLRHDQPEHATYCRGVTGWRPARMRGKLFRLVEGYPLIVLPPAAILHRATNDAAADEAWRRAIAARGLVRPSAAMERFAGARWIDGELLTFSDAATAWPPLDRWEGASTGATAVYTRLIVPIHTSDVAQPMIAAWVYAATRAPIGAVEMPAAPA